MDEQINEEGAGILCSKCRNRAFRLWADNPPDDPLLDEIWLPDKWQAHIKRKGDSSCIVFLCENCKIRPESWEIDTEHYKKTQGIA